MIFGVLALAAVLQAPGERILVEGECPAWSPDGRQIAFQRLRDGTYSLGVVEVASGSVRWVEDDAGQAIHPEWTPSGALLYSYGHDTETALAAEKAKSTSGFSLRLFKDGKKTFLTQGRFRDSVPAVSPDGRAVYFTTSRWNLSYGGRSHMASEIARIPLGASAANPEKVIDAPSGSNSGVAQAAVSPDGTKIVWGSLECFWRSWRICGAALTNVAQRCFVTPRQMIALAPRWHPDGTLLCFTGFKVGDPGWCVYVGDVRRGAFARIASGENPCFSPDGGRICFDRDGRLFTVPFVRSAVDFVPAEDEERPECIGRTLWRTDVRKSGERTDLPREGLAFGPDRTLFITVSGVWDGRERELANVAYEEHGRALSLFLDKEGKPTFSSRAADGEYEGVALGGGLVRGEPFVLTGIRFGDRLAISKDGQTPHLATARYGFLPLVRPLSVAVGGSGNDAPVVRSVEIGSGWPTGVPRPLTRKEVFP